MSRAMAPPQPRKEALEAAARSLIHRDRTVAELDSDLERHGVDPVDRALAIKTMVALGYLDDSRMAANRASALAERGYGDEAIRFDLEGRGVDDELVDDAIAGLEPEAERASRIADRRGPGARTVRALAAKGFSADSIETAVGAGPDP